MRIILREYLGMLRESGEFDALLPDLLREMQFVPLSAPQQGVRQAGVDLAAVGNDANGQRNLWLFVLKRGDLGRKDWDTLPQSIHPSLNEILDVYPDAQTDNMRYDRPAFLESGMSDAPLNLPATAEEMRDQIRRTRSDSPVKEQAVTSAAKAGLPFVDFVASRHFRIPVDPAYWQRILTEATPDNSSPLVPAP